MGGGVKGGGSLDACPRTHRHPGRSAGVHRAASVNAADDAVRKWLSGPRHFGRGDG
ncbi:hypothetical protein SPHINGOAX6_70046 [Sphingomonas sp. AX6]|nr:hypothetical protein SPHINGOAX6_70046 [Sphingomonas sp. AX6]